jgi:hypothetical protein
MAEIPQWHISGDWFDVCSCDIACPCILQLLNAPGSEVGPGQVATWGKATTHRVDALGLKWEAHGKSSKHIPFDWSGPQPS